MREEENGRGEKDRKSVPPETEKGTGAEGKGRIPGWNTRHGTPEALPHEAAEKPPELRPYRLRGQRSGQLYYSHFLYLKYQMVSAEQKIIRPMAKI